MPRKKKEEARPVHYTDAYYAKDGYRTAQYRRKLDLSGRYAQPIKLIDGGTYLFNEFPNRKQRRLVAKRNGIFKHGIWYKTREKMNNVQTYVKRVEPTEAFPEQVTI